MAHPYSILVVDDEPMACSALAALLRAAGFSVMTANDGQAALGILEKFMPDLVVTDLQMPRLDGISLMRKVHERFPHCPVIIVSGSIGSGRDISAGAAAFLSKPIDFGTLRATIERSLHRGKPAA